MKPNKQGGQKTKERVPNRGPNRAKAQREPVKTKDIHNDPAWYTVNGQLLKDVSSFNFNNALGAKFNLNVTDGTGHNYDSTIPGIMAIATMPTVGVSVDENAPVNIAAKNIYSFVRHANSGHSNYDPADLMIYLLAMDSIYTFWSWMVRVYGTANIYSQTNRYIGDNLLKAQGVDPNSIRSRLADFRAYINTFAVKASTMCVPKTMTYFVRHSWMYSNIYKDEDVSKSQMYLYIPAFLYKYQLDTDTGAGMLHAEPLCVELTATPSIDPDMRRENTYDDIVYYGNALLNAMLNQEDIGIMSGDILKAYGKENLWSLVPINEGYGVLPVFSEEVLMQIHNTEFASVDPVYREDGTNWSYSMKGLDIKQDTSVGAGSLIFQPSFKYASHLWYDKLLDFWKEDVSPEMAMVASRNLISGAQAVGSGGTDGLVTIQSCGSEIAFCAYVYKINPVGGTLNGKCEYGIDYWVPEAVSYFNEHPVRLIMQNNHQYVNRIDGEIDNYTVLDQQNVRNLHTTALLSMFGVPYIP